MMMNVRVLVLSLGLLVLVGCTTDKIYRANTSVCRSSNPELECRDSALQEYLNAANPDTRYLLGFIEFDDQGIVNSLVVEREDQGSVKRYGKGSRPWAENNRNRK